MISREEVLKESEEEAQVTAGIPPTAGDDAVSSLALARVKPSFMDSVKAFVMENRMIVAACVVILTTALLLTYSPLGGKLLTQLTMQFQRIITRPAEVLTALLPESHGHDAGFIRSIWLLLMSVVMVPLICRILPGATPVLGFLVGHDFVE